MILRSCMWKLVLILLFVDEFLKRDRSTGSYQAIILDLRMKTKLGVIRENFTVVFGADLVVVLCLYHWINFSLIKMDHSVIHLGILFTFYLWNLILRYFAIHLTGLYSKLPDPCHANKSWGSAHNQRIFSLGRCPAVIPWTNENCWYKHLYSPVPYFSVALRL